MASGERRAAIEAAAARLFGEFGYDGVTLEQVAEAVGVTKPIVYRHFDSKKDLYLAILIRHRDDLPRFVAGEVSGGVAEVRAILSTWLTYAHANPHGWRMLFRDAGGDAEIAAFRRAVHDRAREVMAGFLDRRSGGAIPAQELQVSAEIARGGLAAMIVWWTEHPEVSQATMLNAATRLLGNVGEVPPPIGSQAIRSV